MDLSDLEKRAAEVLPNMVTIGDDGIARPSEDFEALARDITEALAHPDAPAELSDLAKAVEMLKTSVSDPEVAKTMSQIADMPLEPEPEIFEAIEDHDIDKVHAALKTWGVNRAHGTFECTALYRAMSCSTGASIEMMHCLLDAGADPRKGLTDTNVLHGLGFAQLKDIDPRELTGVVRRCVEGGADIEQRSNNLRWTPLITAVSEWNPVATEALLLAGANISARVGDVEGSCFAGADCLAFAQGHPETTAVLKRYLTPH